MDKVMPILRSLWREEDGAAAVEYGLLVALIAVVIMVAAASLGTNVKATFCAVINALKDGGVTGAVTAGC